MRLAEGEARGRLGRERVARLATVGGGGRPRVVPITFALRGGQIVTAVDHKPKSTRDLGRLRDIRANPWVSVLVDRYEDDWTRLWWVRADGVARVVEGGGEAAGAVAVLREKYEQYRERVPEGPFIVVQVERWSGWAYDG